MQILNEKKTRSTVMMIYVHFIKVYLHGMDHNKQILAVPVFY